MNRYKKLERMDSMTKRSDSVSVVDFGALGDGVADDAPAIQAALDSGAREVRIPAGTFAVGDALRPHSGQSLALFGTLKIADAHRQPLTAPAAIGDDTIEVADASGYRVGQWLTFSADDSPLWQTRRHADCGRIAAIDGRRLRFAGRLTMDYPLAVHPFIATQHSAIWLDRVSRVRIYGSGVIDANKAGQIDVRPTALAGCGFRAATSIGGDEGEEIRAACGIAASGPPGTLEQITIEGITVRDASEHNLCLTGLAFSRVLNTVCTGARDKNITLLDSRDCILAGNIASYSEHEDGIMFHQKTGNERILVQGNICTGNPRQGISVGFRERDIHLSGNLCTDNGVNLAILGIDCSSTGDICRGQNYTRFGRERRPYGVALGGVNTRVTNLSVTGDRLVLVEIAGENVHWLGGSVRGTRAAGDNTGILLGISSNCAEIAAPPTRTIICGVDVHDCHAGLKLHGKLQDVRVTDNRFRNNDCAIEQDAELDGACVLERNG